MQQARLDAGADVLEGEGRSVEELESEDPVGDAHQGYREVERVCDERVERGLRNLIAQQVHANDRRNRNNPGGASNRLELCGGKRLETLRHIQAAVGSGAGKERVDERHRW